MNAHDEAALSVWQQLREAGLTPEERTKNLDDQIRMDSLLRSFFAEVRADEYEVQLRLVSEEMASCVTDTRLLSV
ncbi:hypothetical protein V1290_000016 [Bradyrhizobium sp. AZCC 1578]|uniref:hypothetical protein n=1 Tax=Bradyrhizobium sp. AZCC 1578 TaxID=3117027 RepID=UPI002FF19686